MRVLVMHNPVSGRGRSGEVADRVRDTLAARGLVVERRHTPPRAGDVELRDALRQVDAAVIVGGDGAMRRVAPALIDTGVPVYNLACGTENLFARQFQMSRAPEAVAGAIGRMGVKTVDVGRCGDEVFLLMCGIGADAAVVHRLSRARTGAITHASYARHVLAELVRGRSPRVTIRSGGRTLVDARRGAAVVANSRQYALRIDPAPSASMTDGRLDLAFFPAMTSAGALMWNLASKARAASGRAARRLGVIRAVAPEFELTVHDEPAQFQLDGDAREDETPRAEASHTIACQRGCLKVLLP